MVSQWRVTYDLIDPALMEKQVAAYPDLSLTFEYDSDGRLSVVHHQLNLEDSSTEVEALSQSNVALTAFWEMANHRQGMPLVARTRRAQQLSQCEAVKATFRCEVFMKADAIAVKPIVLPKAGVLHARNDRIRTRLRLANDARDAADDAAALRIYFIVLEDYLTDGPRPPLFDEIRYVRNFVSHSKLTREKTMQFIQAQLKSNVTRFDPFNNGHQRLVQTYREKAAELVSDNLNAELGRMS